ncbi:MAG: hypothetical protein NTX88_10115, partial [Candidatus Atribacteria bacterium]|nr:hypothetical protein [Candidatus Atribacteria bacterium]
SYIEVIFRSSTENKNRLWIEIQPEERIDFFINSKKPGEGLASTPVRLNFNVLGTFGINSPEAYENILFDCYQGDKTLFPDPGFILQSWKIIDQLKALLHQGKIKPETYPDDNLTPEYFFSSV